MATAATQSPEHAQPGQSQQQQIQQELDAPFPLTPEHIAFYRDMGYLKLKQVLSPTLLEHYRQEINAQVARLSADALPMEQRTTYGKAFLQIMNLWTKSPIVRELVFSKRLARIAADLMEVSGVRLYHDQALYKEPGGGITPWHADQYYWPVESDKTVTAWIPLQDTPRSMGPLAFCQRSHQLQTGRELGISDESQAALSDALRSYPQEDGPFDLGEISFHSGWLFHRAGPNTSSQPREVMTIIYVDENMRLTVPQNKNQQADLETWSPGQQPGDLLASPLNPVLYSSNEAV